MSSFNLRGGVPTVFLSVNSANDVPDADTLVFTACDVTLDPLDKLNNSVNQELKAADTYQVIVGLVGRDAENGGYTVGETSLSSGDLTVAADGNGIKVKVLNTDWPSNFDEAVCAAIFLKINNAKFQLCQFAYVSPEDDFTTMISAKPLRVAPRFDLTVLQSTDEDEILGSRDPKGITYVEIPLTTGDFTFRRPVSTITVSPNISSDFQVVTSRGVGISFQSLINDVKNFVRAAAGLWVRYDDGGADIEEAHMSLNTAQVLFGENRAVQVFMPADKNGDQEVRLLIGLLTVNQSELTEAWSKTAITPVTFQFDGAALDRLISNQFTEVAYTRKA